MSNLRSKQSPDILRKPVDQFTLNFLRKKWELSNEDDFVFCPIGIITINIMLLEGAQGKTADQIMSILHLEPTFKSVEDIRNQLKMVKDLLESIIFQIFVPTFSNFQCLEITVNSLSSSLSQSSV